MKTQFCKKLYLSLLIASLFVTSAKTQIVYTDVLPDDTLSYPSDTFNLDMNNDISIDYKLNYSNGYAYCYCVSGGYNMDHTFITTLNNSQVLADLNSLALKLGSNDSISGTSLIWSANFYETLINQGPSCPSSCALQNFGNWLGAVNNYIGLKFFANGFTYYGWVRISMANFTNGAIIKDYAFNSIPEQFILAGDTGTSSTGMIETAIRNDIDIFPNPFTISATLTLNLHSEIENTQLKIFDMTGRVVKQYEIRNAKTEIKIENLSSGIYFYKVGNENEIIGTGKFIVQ